MINLQRKVNIRSYEYEATILVAQERPEFLAVASLADEKGSISDKDVAILFGGLPNYIGKKIIDRAVSMGLLNWGENKDIATISDIGKATLERGQVLVRQEGVFRFYVLEDPLLGSSIIHYDRVDTQPARDERDILNNPKSDVQKPTSVSIDKINYHSYKDSSDNSILLESISNGKIYSIERLAAEGEESNAFTSTLYLTLNIDLDPTVQLDDLVPNLNSFPRIRINHQPLRSIQLMSISYVEIWKYLIGQSEEIDSLDADRSENFVIHVPFYINYSPKTLKQFNMEVNIIEPEMIKLGKFESISVNNVKVKPKNATDANEWARWLQWESIEDYQVPSTINTLKENIEEIFHEFEIGLPDSQDLLKRALENPTDPTSKYILTPYDLNLWREND